MNRTGDYALVGDSRAAALVGRDGSIGRLCLPSGPGRIGRAGCAVEDLAAAGVARRW